jgi:hypothetical protein
MNRVSKKMMVTKVQVWSVLMVILCLSIFVLMLLMRPVQANWFNDLWRYRQKLTVGTVTTELIDYQIQIVGLDTQTLYTAGKLQANCEDIRFTDLQGNLLEYWIEDDGVGCSTDTTTDIWVRVPRISTTGTTLYMYYGNSSAAAYQNGNKTFELFDDFEGGSLSSNIWTTTGTPNVTGGTLVLSNNAGIQSLLQFTQGRRFITRASQSNTALNLGRLGFSNRAFGTGYTADDSASFLFDSSTGGNFENDQGNEGIVTTGTGTIAENTSTNDMEIGWGTTASVFLINGTQNSSIATNIPNESSYIRLENTDVTNALTLQWVAVTKFANSTPASPILGTEEKGNGPVLFMPMNDGSGTFVSDKSGSGGNGTLTNGPTWEEDCINGKCIGFDGTNDYILLSNESMYDFERTAPFSACIWFKPDTLSARQGTLFSKLVPSGNFTGWELSANDGTTDSNGLTFYLIGVWTANRIQLSYANILQSNVWQHICVTYSGNNNASGVKMYVDGRLVTGTPSVSYSSLSATILNNQNVSIGARNDGTHPANGLLDEAYIFPRELSGTDILKIYSSSQLNTNLGNKGSLIRNNLRMWFKLDEATGTAANDSSGWVTNGTLTGGPTVVGGKYANARSFDGTDDYIATTLNLDQTSAGGGAAFSMWVYPTSTAAGTYHLISTNNGDFDWSIVRNGANWEVYTGTSSQPTGATVTLNTWQHIMAVFDPASGKIRFYKDGTEYVINELSYDTSDNNINIMRNPATGGHFAGRLDDVRVYTKAIDQQLAKDVYNSTPGPVLHLKLDELSGNTAVDSSISGLNGTLTNMDNSDWVNGKIANGLDFDGVNDYIIIPDNDALEGGNKRTFSVWYKPTSVSATGLILEKGDPNNATVRGAFYLAQCPDGKLGVHVRENSTNFNQFASTTVLTPGQWYFLTLVLDFDQAGTDDMQLYVNGLKETRSTSTGCVSTISSTNLTTTMLTNTSSFYVGVHDSNGTKMQYINGILDDIKVYNYALTNEMIRQEFKDTPDNEDLIAHWRFDETSWNGTANEVIDSSNRGNHGTAVNGAIITENGRIFRGGEFDGSNDFVQASFTLPPVFTCSGWMYWTGTNNSTAPGMMQVQNGGSAPTTTPSGKVFGAWFDTNDRTIWGRLVQSNGSSRDLPQSTSIAMPTATWTHLTYRANGSVFQLFVNGEPKSSVTYNGTIATNNTAFLGAEGNGYFKGTVDEIKCYSRALTDGEITSDYISYRDLFAGTEQRTSAKHTLYYKFDEKSGTTAVDYSGNSLNGTLTNMDATTDWTSRGKIGGALDFDGVNDYVLTADNNLLDASSAISISMWVKPRSFANSPFLLLKTNTTFAEIYKVGFNATGTIDWRINDTAQTSTTAATLNEWNHILVTFSGTQKKIYLNGVLVGTANQTATITNGNSGLYLGVDVDSASDLNQYFDGQMDNIKIWSNITLSQNDVAIEYNGGAPVAYWKFDEGQGGSAYDYSGSAANGVLTNMDPANDWVSGKLNGAIDLDGVNDYIRVDNDARIDKITEDVSISVWVKPAATQNQYATIFSNHSTGTGDGGFTIEQNSTNTNQFYFGWISAGNVFHCGTTNTVTLVANQWNHLVFSKTGSTVRGYVDGKLQRTCVGGSATISPNTLLKLNIGSWAENNTRQFSGQLDEVKIFNYGLTESDIKREYNLGAILRFE